MKLAALEEAILNSNQEIALENTRHDKFIKLHTDRINEFKIARDQVMLGVDVDMVELAESIIYIKGFSRLREDMIQDAITDVLTDFKHLRVCNIAIKDYERFAGQRTDCEYGMGPRHGYIVSEIGMHPSRTAVIDPDEVEAVMYFLNCCRNAAYLKTRIDAEEAKRAERRNSQC